MSFTERALDITKNRQDLVSVVCGVLAGLVFSVGLSSYCLIVLLLPIIAILRRSSYVKTQLQSVFYFFLAFHLVVLSWFLDTYIKELGAQSDNSSHGVILSWLIMSLFMSLCMLIIVYLVRFSKPGTKTWFVVLPAAWVFGEYVRSLGFSLFLYGNGATIGDYWNFGSLGYAAISTPLAPLSRFIGLYGLTFLVVIFTAGVYELITHHQFHKLPYYLVGLLLFGLAGQLALFSSSATAGQYEGSVLQQSGDVSDSRNQIAIQNQSASKKDLIVMPEYSNVYASDYAPVARQYVEGRLNKHGVSLNVSKGTQKLWYGTLEIRNNQGKILAAQTKELLIPTGEYLPTVLTTFYNHTGQRDVVKKFDLSRRVQKGEPPQTYKTDGLTVGPVACSGILGRNIYQGFAKAGANVLTNSASLQSFNGSASYFRQSLMMAKFHAIANGRAFIQATRGAPSFVLDADGRFIVRPGDTETKFIDFEFPAYKSRTVYTHLGEWVLQSSVAFLLLMGIFKYGRGTWNRTTI